MSADELLRRVHGAPHPSLAVGVWAGRGTAGTAAPHEVAAWAEAADAAGAAGVYVAVNEVRPGVRGRGTAADVTRLRALVVDLDDPAPDGSGKSLDPAEHAGVIADLADLLGTGPAAVVSTGHGTHGWWAVEPEPLPADAAGLLAAWGRLCRTVTAAHGGDCDAVFDLARVMRVPGTTNRKDPDPAGWRHVTAVYPAAWRRLTVAGVRETLAAYAPALAAAPGLPAPAGGTGEGEVCDPAGWPWAADEVCAYTRTMLGAWAAEPASTWTHGTHYARLVRLACARRHGCLTEAAWGEALAAAAAGRDAYLRGQGREPDPTEEHARQALCAVGRAALKDGPGVLAELGGTPHMHGSTVPAEVLAGLSGHPPTERGRLALLARLEALREAGPEARRERLVSAVCCAVRLAYGRRYPLAAGLAAIEREAADRAAQVTEVAAWAIAREVTA